MKFERNLVGKNFNNENLGKKEFAAAARQRLPPQKKNYEDTSGSIRDITAHLIHDQNTSIAEPSAVFNFPSAGYNPRWIYWSYEILFFQPWGLWTQRPAQTGPGCQNMAFQRFDPIIIHDFSRRLRKTRLVKPHGSQHAMNKRHCCGCHQLVQEGRSRVTILIVAEG